MLTYIGVGTAPYGCAIATVRRTFKPGIYVVEKLWESNVASCDKIIFEIIDSFKKAEFSNEEVIAIKEKVIEDKKLTLEQIYTLNTTDWLIQYFNIVCEPNGIVEDEIENIDVKYEGQYQTLNYKYSAPKILIKASLEIMTLLFNDGKVLCKEEADRDKLDKEIKSITPETINNISPMLKALSLSVGEGEFRRRYGKEDIPIDMGAYARGLNEVANMMRNPYGRRIEIDRSP